MARPQKNTKTNKQGVINRDVNAANRAAMAVHLRAQRLTFDEIARRAGYASPGAARNAIQRELQRTMSENTDELRREELDMLNRLHAAVWPLAVPDKDEVQAQDTDDEEAEESEEAKKKKRAHLFAVDRIIAISDRRSKLMGLDKQEKGNVQSGNTIVIREVPINYLGAPQETSVPPEAKE